MSFNSGRWRKAKYASPRPRRRESSVISISSDSELEEVKRPSRHVVERSKARGVALKKSKSSARLIYEENSDDRDFIDDSALVDDESDEGSVLLYYHLCVFLHCVDIKVSTG